MILPVHHTWYCMAIGIPAGLFKGIIQAQGFYPFTFHMHARQCDIRVILPPFEGLIIPVGFIPKAAQQACQFPLTSVPFPLYIRNIHPILSNPAALYNPQHAGIEIHILWPLWP